MRTTAVAQLAVALALTSTPAARCQNSSIAAELPNVRRVSATLYRGRQPGSDDFRRLAQLGIKTVLNLRAHDDNSDREEKLVKEAGLRYLNIPLHRLGKPEPDTIKQILEIIESPANQPVLVHCQHGADRTGLVVAIYRIADGDWTAKQAIDEANRYGMKFWQRGMKEFIRDYEKRIRATPRHSP